MAEDDALRLITELCLSFPEAAAERSGSHATFRVRKKVFAYFLDNHHDDGIVFRSSYLATAPNTLASLIREMT